MSPIPLSTQGEDKRGTENPAEARFVVELLDRVYRFYGSRFDAQKTVGVIVPYRTQIAVIYKEIARQGLEEALGNITIDTVERYQGAQRDVIIYSFTVTHPNQLAFLTANIYTDSEGRLIDRKLNVALTRARRQMLMTGCTEVMREYPLYRELIDDYAVSMNDDA
jgi:superfamily I DNA and/or RNA helicase